jgi:hypothetical protein
MIESGKILVMSSSYDFYDAVRIFLKTIDVSELDKTILKQRDLMNNSLKV